MSFATWVPSQAAYLAGFNEHAVSFSLDFPHYGNKHGSVYHSKLEKTNMILVEFPKSPSQQEEEFFFGTFDGKEPSEFNKPEDKAEFYHKVRNIVSPERKFPGHVLERIITEESERIRGW